MNFLRKTLGIQENDEEKLKHDDFEWISLGKHQGFKKMTKKSYNTMIFRFQKYFLKKTLGIPQKDEKSR